MSSTIPSKPLNGDLSLTSRPCENGRFGRFGGQYVPETLMPALAELENAAAKAWQDPLFTKELRKLLGLLKIITVQLELV